MGTANIYGVSEMLKIFKRLVVMITAVVFGCMGGRRNKGSAWWTEGINETGRDEGSYMVMLKRNVSEVRVTKKKAERGRFWWKDWLARVMTEKVDDKFRR